MRAKSMPISSAWCWPPTPAPTAKAGAHHEKVDLVRQAGGRAGVGPSRRCGVMVSSNRRAHARLVSRAPLGLTAAALALSLAGPALVAGGVAAEAQTAQRDAIGALIGRNP